MQNVVSPPVLIRKHGEVCQYRKKKPCSTQKLLTIEEYKGLRTRLDPYIQHRECLWPSIRSYGFVKGQAKLYLWLLLVAVYILGRNIGCDFPCVNSTRFSR